MLKYSEMRRIEVFVNGKWKKAQSIGQIEKGDVFRVFELDGSAVPNEQGGPYFVARSDAAMLLVDSLP